ncbi:MBL fold metallo-hydrolase [Lysobacter psychrotolerans]|uniref:MBL fold metallo-hydrolase n=2 Tax=Montanilutibacter psychrotolerans TaxID=1327343 RepID=A0A3M8T416_9GAMM|nr:MBL fold metallo-hydrolase [Lysobacter psychrotolerans]
MILAAGSVSHPAATSEPRPSVATVQVSPPPDTHSAKPLSSIAQPPVAPTPKPQLPGVYRFDVGAFRITALSDGTLPLDLHPLLRGATAGQIEALLHAGFARNPIETSINAYVVDSGSRVVLIDTGAGELFGSLGGKLPESLAAAGYRPEQISDVLITHIHTDHSGGLARAGRRVFPNATVHVAQADVDFFLDRGNLGRGLEPRHLAEALATIEPYRRAGKLKAFTGETVVLPGITAIPTPGHTPGHSFYRVESANERIEFWGDILHVGAIQLPRPDVTITFDVDQPAAKAQRARQFAAAAGGRRLVAAAHLPFPGLGYLRREGDGYAWVSAEYRNRE